MDSSSLVDYLDLSVRHVQITLVHTLVERYLAGVLFETRQRTELARVTSIHAFEHINAST